MYDVKEYTNKQIRNNCKLKRINTAQTSAFDNGFRDGFLIKDQANYSKPILLAGKLRFFEVNLEEINSVDLGLSLIHN